MRIDYLVFLVALLPIPYLVVLASKRSTLIDEFGGKTYGKLMVGLSAAATGNSGFIMTGAVGLGYAYGVQWILLPLSWLIGDLVFWKYGPRRINEYCQQTGCVNVAQIVSGKNPRLSPYIYASTAILLAIFLGVYISSQWVAGSKIISGFMGIEPMISVMAIGVFVTGYCMKGKFRGSVYTDLYQGGLMVAVTVLSLYFAIGYEKSAGTALPNGFSSLLGSMSFASATGFVIGYAMAGIGFGFGQPQITSRYIAAKDPNEAASAKWIYILFLQATWIGMTYFGVLLRSKGFVADDPEGALIPFFQIEAGQVLTGLAAAGIFAAIASTVDSIVMSITSLYRNRYNGPVNISAMQESIIIFFVGLVTVVSAVMTEGSVFAIALMAISMIGATLAGPVVIRLYRIKHTDASVMLALVGGGAIGYWWRSSPYGAYVNEALIGILFSFIVNHVTVLLSIGEKREKGIPRP